jgi:thioredoxin 1
MIAPVLDELAGEMEGRLKVCKVDVDANPEVPPKFGIRGIPTLIIFKDGDVAATKVGALSRTQLNDFIREVV